MNICWLQHDRDRSMSMLRLCLVFVLCSSCLVQVRATASDKQAFVLLGATGDNAYRAAGFRTGLFEAWSNGLLKNTDVHAQINKGHTVDSIHRKMMATLNPFYEILQQDSTFKCQAPDQDCEPQTFYEAAQMNVWQGEGGQNVSSVLFLPLFPLSARASVSD